MEEKKDNLETTQLDQEKDPTLAQEQEPSTEVVQEVVEEKKEDIPQSATSYEINEDGAIVIDNTKNVEEDIPVPATLDRTAKLKEPISKNKKIAIMCISVAVIVVLFCAIFFPCFFYFRGKVMVSSADDFKDGESGKYFVLRKNVVVEGNLDLSKLDCSIDLNGHDLTVKGKLVISNQSAKAMQIGTKDGDNYISKGILTVDDLEIETPNADVNLVSTVVVKGALNIKKARTVTITGASIINSSSIEATRVVINKALTPANNEITCTFKAPNVDIFGNVSVENCIFETSSVIVHKTATIKNATLDEASNIQIYGSANLIKGGNKVAILDTATCPKFDSVKLLAIYKAQEKTFSTANCSKIIYLDKLSTPIDLIVVEEDSKFKATSAKVITNGKPVNYEFTYVSPNGKETKSTKSTDNFFDITPLLKGENGAALITLKVQAKGDYDFTTLDYDALNDGDYLYLDSDVKSIKYEYALTLSTPTGLNITKVDDELILSFNAVEFADFYYIVFDGKTKVKADSNSLDIKNYVSDLGYHSIRITANSTSKELKPSKEAMISYKTVAKIATPQKITATCKKLGEEKYVVNMSFEAVSGVYLIKVGDKSFRISNQTTLSFESETDLTGASISVKVEGYDFYNDSDIATCVITQD